MSKRQYLTWQEAIKEVQKGKKLFFHHRGKAVPIDKNTTFQQLQWDYFDLYELTWNDILNGKYSIVPESQ